VNHKKRQPFISSNNYPQHYLETYKKPILSHFSMNFYQTTAVDNSAKSLLNKRLL